MADGFMGQGIFDMDFINEMNSLGDVGIIKTKALERIDSSSALDRNRVKATLMVNKSRTKNDLIFGMTNFSLSFQGLAKL